MTTIILPQATYDALVDRLVAEPELLNLTECSMTGRFERYQVEDKLGGDYDIWPERLAAYLEHFDDPIELPAFLLDHCRLVAA